MTVITAAWKSRAMIVATPAESVDTVTAGRTLGLLGSDAIAARSASNAPETTEAIIVATSSTPAVGHHRPFTSRRERPSARAGPIPSISSAGAATDHRT